jgi:hypothetical protein
LNIPILFSKREVKLNNILGLIGGFIILLATIVIIEIFVDKGKLPSQ